MASEADYVVRVNDDEAEAYTLEAAFLAARVLTDELPSTDWLDVRITRGEPDGVVD